MGKKIGRNDLCWCGSGRKFKYCHLDREKAKPLPQQEIIEAIKKAYSKKYCLHPLANPQQCSGGIIKSHTIQRSGGLSRIAEEGHVFTCLHPEKPNKSLEEHKPKVVGIGNASTFTGFCARHDDEVFAPIEKYPFQNDPEQAFLLAYRAICHELFLKKANCELTKVMRSRDRGLNIKQQALVQLYVSDYQAGVAKSIHELTEIKSKCDAFLLGNDYTKVKFYIVTLQNPPEILCSATHQPEYDFLGRTLQRLGFLNRPTSWIHFTLTATDSGGAAVFSWLDDNEVCLSFIQSFNSLSDEDIPHALVRYVFEFFENTYFAPAWWDKLESATQKQLVKRQLTEISLFSEYTRNEKCLLDDGIRAVDWRVTSRKTNVEFTEAV